MKQRINIDRLLKLAGFLDELPHKNFTFNSWVGFGFNGKLDLSCGTTACALGWATTIPEFRGAGLCLVTVQLKDGGGFSFPALDTAVIVDDGSVFKYTAEATEKVFGLNETETELLFIGDNVPVTPSDDGHYEYDEYGGAHWIHDKADHKTIRSLTASTPLSPKEVAKHIRNFCSQVIDGTIRY